MKGKKQLHSKSTPATDSWETPRSLFQVYNELYDFNLDAAASISNTKCLDFFDIDDNALAQSWFGRVWCNPPYSKVRQFVEWASLQAKNCEVICMLLPARTDTYWFHAHIWRGRETPELTYSDKTLPEVIFLQRRIQFELDDKPVMFQSKKTGKWSKGSAPFPSMVVVWNKLNKKENKK